MKKSDWGLIIFAAIISGFVAFFITNSLMGGGEEKEQGETVKTTVVFSAQVDDPNEFVFRVGDPSSNVDRAINPAVPITTGGVTKNKDSNNKEGDENKDKDKNDDNTEENDNNGPNSQSGSNSELNQSDQATDSEPILGDGF
jgi:hypothetical protein